MVWNRNLKGKSFAVRIYDRKRVLNLKGMKWGLTLMGIVFAGCAFHRLLEDKKQSITALKEMNDRYLDNYRLLCHWLEVKNEGGSTADYFRDMGYRRIAIYGMAELANRLLEDIEGQEMEVVYGIDQDAACCVSKIEAVYSLQEEFPEADVVVVTPYYAMESIRKELEKKVTCPIVSIEDIVWSV